MTEPLHIRNYQLLDHTWRPRKKVKSIFPQKYGSPKIHRSTSIGFGFNLCPMRTSNWMAKQIFSLSKDERVVFFPNYIRTWQRLAWWIGLFPSEGQAKKNGWSGPLPEGYTKRKIKSKQPGFMGQEIYLFVPPTPHTPTRHLIAGIPAARSCLTTVHSTQAD